MASASPTQPELPLSYRLARLGRLIRKELSEILRDRRTVLTLVLMPLLLYPLISIALQQFFVASGLNVSAKEAYRVGVVDEHEFRVFMAAMKKGSALIGEKSESKKPATLLFTRETSWVAKNQDALEQAVVGGAVDVGVRIPSASRIAVNRTGLEPLLPADEAITCEVLIKADSLRALTALTYIERRLAALNNANLKSRLGLENATPKVVLIEPQTTALQATGEALLSLAALVPLVLILMTMTGAVYPAIDLTAGERERGTLEMLIAAPVPRLSLLFAKYVAVVSVATLTALVNLSAMISTIYLSGLAGLVFQGRDLSISLVIQLLGLLLLFAAFFSAVLLSLTSFARSFKEAQAYLIPLMLVSFAPGMMGMMPGLKLEGGFMIVPLLNIVLLSRDLLQNEANPLAAVVIIASTLLYAMAAIAVAARFFGSEGVLFNTENTWSDLFRRPARPQPYASVATTFTCMAVMLPTWFVLHNVIARLGVAGTETFILIAALSVLLFAGIPLLAALRRRVDLRSGFRIHQAPWPAYVAAVMLGFSAWPLVFQLLIELFPYLNLKPEDYEKLLQHTRQARGDHTVLMAVCLMVAAAVEEFYFRGFLFAALRTKMTGFATVVVTAAIFGFFHVITGLFIQLAPSFLLGLLLGWICLRTGSVLPGMLMHAIHNAMMVAVGAIGVAGNSAVPAGWLGAGAIGTVAGLLLLEWARRRQRPVSTSAA